MRKADVEQYGLVFGMVASMFGGLLGIAAWFLTVHILMGTGLFSLILAAIAVLVGGTLGMIGGTLVGTEYAKSCGIR